MQYQLSVSGGDGNYQNVGIVASEFEVLGLEDTVTLAVSNYTYAISSPAKANGFVSACGPEWQYAPGMTIAFAANVFDAQTGKEPGPELIEGVEPRVERRNRIPRGPACNAEDSGISREEVVVQRRVDARHEVDVDDHVPHAPALGRDVQSELLRVEPVELAWQGGDGEHADEVWEGTLELPEDARTGTYEYEIYVDAPARDIHDVGIATDTFTVI